MSKVKVVQRIQELNLLRENLENKAKSIGFVPTMGALHKGHLSLVRMSCAENDLTIISIFVNPKQFNNQEDLKAYPRTLDSDLRLLEEFKNCMVYIPDEKELYPQDDGFVPMDLGIIGQVLEGVFRPGHFDGVVHVVHQLFKLIDADVAYFGQKDFQQLAIIKLMTKHYGFRTLIKACPTVREENGLAMSSRNMRLSTSERSDALIIIQTLHFLASLRDVKPINEALAEAHQFFHEGKLTLEYLCVVDPETLVEIESWQKSQLCCIAAYCGSVRLIDNLLF